MASQTPKAAPKATPKAVSSRLLSMKFMQRAAASASASPTTPKSDIENGTKRRKVSNASPASSSVIDSAAIQAALEEDERKRQAAIEKQAAELGDSHWVLNIPAPPFKLGQTLQTPLNVVQIGWAEIDTKVSIESSSPQSSDLRISDAGKFRRYNMKKSKATDDESESEGDGSCSSGEDSSEATSPGPGGRDVRGREFVAPRGPRKRTRSEASSKRSTDGVKAQQYAEKRRKKEINLNGLISISSQGGQSSQSWASAVRCYRCGRTGHKANQCPSNSNP